MREIFYWSCSYPTNSTCFYRHFRQILDDLVLPDRFPCCKDLAVDVGETDLVIVDQVERPDAASRERLRRKSADAADPENRDPLKRSIPSCPKRSSVRENWFSISITSFCFEYILAK